MKNNYILQEINDKNELFNIFTNLFKRRQKKPDASSYFLLHFIFYNIEHLYDGIKQTRKICLNKIMKLVLMSLDYTLRSTGV